MRIADPRALRAMAVGLLAIACASINRSPYWLLYNASESVPRGWYFVSPADHLQLNGLSVVRLPKEIASFAGMRRYLPRNVPLIKPVAAMAGQRVCIADNHVTIDSHIAAMIRTHDGAGRPLTSWSACRPLAVDEVFLLSTFNDASFDSRYFGPVHLNDIIGRASPLWTW